MDTVLEPRLGIGGNNPPSRIEIVRARLAEETAALKERADELGALELPAAIESAEQAENITNNVAACTAHVAKAERARVEAKEPSLEEGREIDRHFTALKRPVDAVKQKMVALQTVWLTKLADIERRRREAEAEEQRRIQREAEAAAREQARIAREAREAEERRQAEARAAAEKLAGEERRKAEAAEAERRAAEQARLDAEKAEADRLRAAAREAKSDATEAKISAQARPADLVRTRSDLGASTGLRTTWTFEVENAEEVPREYVIVDLPAVRAAIKRATDKDGRCKLKIPGIRIYAESAAVTRR